MNPKDRRLLLDLKSGETSISKYRDNEKHACAISWMKYIDGKNRSFPENAMRADFARIRSRIEAMRMDETTPDTRLADDPMKFNPASISSLIHLMLGGLHLGHQGNVLHCSLRYFDPVNRRAGIAQDVGALIDDLNDEGMRLTLVNTNQIEPRTVLIQAGGYAEHQFLTVIDKARTMDIGASNCTVRLEPGCGTQMLIRMKRYANQPTMIFPWDR